MKPRLLVTGGAGFVGGYLLRQANHFVATGTLHHTPATSLPGVTFHVCNLLVPQEVNILFNRVRPDVIIHTACSEQGNGIEGIVPAAGLLAMQAAERGIRLIHLSTDQVFDGETAPYTETSPANPVNAYGKAKAQAEELILSLHPSATIVRTSLLYDLRTPDRPTRWLMESMATSKPVRLFLDEFRCPVWVENLCDLLLELATLEFSGILHLGGPQALNRWELGMGLLHHFGITATPNIQQGTIQESGLVRPKDLTLDSTRAHQTLRTPFLSLNEASNQSVRTIEPFKSGLK